MLAGGVALLIVFFALGAVRAAGFPSAGWSAVLALATGAGALTWTYLERTSDLTPIGALLGPTVVLSIAVQLWRRDGRAELTSSLTISVAACVLAVLPVTWVALRESSDGIYSVGFALLGVGAVALADVLPVSRALRRVVGVLVAAVAAGVLVMTVERIGDAVPPVSAVVVAAFAGVIGAIGFAAVDRIADEAGHASARASERAPEQAPERGPERATSPHAGDHRPVSNRVGRRAADRARSGAVSSPDPKPDEGKAPSGEDAEQTAEPTEYIRTMHRARGMAALLPLRVTLPFIGAGPAAFVLGRIFIG